MTGIAWSGAAADLCQDLSLTPVSLPGWDRACMVSRMSWGLVFSVMFAWFACASWLAGGLAGRILLGRWSPWAWIGLANLATWLVLVLVIKARHRRRWPRPTDLPWMDAAESMLGIGSMLCFGLLILIVGVCAYGASLAILPWNHHLALSCATVVAGLGALGFVLASARRHQVVVNGRPTTNTTIPYALFPYLFSGLFLILMGLGFLLVEWPLRAAAG